MQFFDLGGFCMVHRQLAIVKLAGAGKSRLQAVLAEVPQAMLDTSVGSAADCLTCFRQFR
jgi:hypothetical protein